MGRREGQLGGGPDNEESSPPIHKMLASLPFLHKHQSGVNRRIRHTFIACGVINPLVNQSPFFLFTWWRLIMLPGQVKLLISLSQPPKELKLL